MLNKKEARPTYQCSFCGKQQDQVERIIAGPGGVAICNKCVDLCQQIFREERARHEASILPKQ